MYDQIKLNGITAKIRGLNGSSAITLSNTPTIVTAWDRNGLDNTTSPAQNVSNPPIVTYNNVSAYSSAIISNWSPGNAFKITRHLYPSTMSEKSYYITSSSLTANATGRNPALDYVSRDGQNFKPILLIGAYCGFTTTVAQAIGFMIEFDITTTFRGLRKYQLTPDSTADQISLMSGVYLNGSNGAAISSVTGTAWTRVNNDGNIEQTDGTTIPNNEVPTIKTEGS